jgi:hypothetical protein
MATGARSKLNVTLEAGDVISGLRAGSIYVGDRWHGPAPCRFAGRPPSTRPSSRLGGATNVAALADVRLYRTQASGSDRGDADGSQRVRGGEGLAEVEKNDVVIVGKSAVKAFFFGVYDLLRGMVGVGVGL